MKAELISNSSSFSIRFTPEEGDDVAILKVMARMVARQAYYISSKGFDYMEPSVEFSVYPQGRRDD